MAEPIRSFTPHRDVREELRRKVESAPVDHAEALLAAYEVLQEAQDHGVLDTLRGAIGAGGTIIGKVSEYANTPEGVRLMRNMLAAMRLVGELDPAMLDAAAKAVSRFRNESQRISEPASLWRSLQRLASLDGRRSFAAVAEISESFGAALAAGRESSSPARPDARQMDTGVAVPVVAGAAVFLFAAFWVGRKSR